MDFSGSPFDRIPDENGFSKTQKSGLSGFSGIVFSQTGYQMDFEKVCIGFNGCVALSHRISPDLSGIFPDLKIRFT